MCLAIPGKILSKQTDAPLLMGKVSFAGVEREVCLAYVPEAELGEYVIVHAGFAIARVDEEKAERTLAYLEASAPTNEGEHGG